MHNAVASVQRSLVMLSVEYNCIYDLAASQSLVFVQPNK